MTINQVKFGVPIYSTDGNEWILYPYKIRKDEIICLMITKFGTAPETEIRNYETNNVFSRLEYLGNYSNTPNFDWKHTQNFTSIDWSDFAEDVEKYKLIKSKVIISIFA